MQPFINIHTHSLSSNPEVISIFNVDYESLSQRESSNHPISILSHQHITPSAHQHINQSAGIHPWYIDNIDISEHLNILEKLVRERQICAVGEIGLDKACKSDFKQQEAVFKAQLGIASKNNLPVIIHCVKAYNEVSEILTELKHTTPVIFHGFNSSLQMAQQLINKGYYLSFGPEICNPRSKRREIIKQIPLNQLFLETDDREINICQLYEEASILLKMQEVELREVIEMNFKCMFGGICE